MRKSLFFLSLLSAMLLTFVGCKEKNEPAAAHSENGHEWVDLGLSVKWATMNVGATTPDGAGYYFAWGEVTPKVQYTWSNYILSNGSPSSVTKYHYLQTTVLESSDDAAAMNWRGKWRMPTHKEMNELLTRCTLEWRMQGNAYGCDVAGPNGNHIFLPAAGYYDDSQLCEKGSNGLYWSSTIGEVSDRAYHFDLTPLKQECGTSSRYYGIPVRAVLP